MSPSSKPNRTTTVLLVRHGQTPTTGRVLPGRAPGLHLSPAGLEQAETVADRLSPLRLAAVYTSPLERAAETAAPTATATGLVPVTEPGLLECDFGEWTGKTLSSLYRQDRWRSLIASPSTFRFPEGESLAELSARVVSVLDRIRSDHPGSVVACFTHADPIRAALTYAIGAPLDAFHRVKVETGSVSAIQFAPGGPPVVLTTNSLAGSLVDLTSTHPDSGEPGSARPQASAGTAESSRSVVPDGDR